MEGRLSRVRGGSWRRGGRGGNEGEGFGGEHRGRGRGGPYRGRGKRDHHRGRGRGGGAHVTESHHRDQDEEQNLQEENDQVGVFSRRKLESNWGRYEESERQEPDDDIPSQRGADYHVLLESAGDSFTQFRFSEEKDWEMDPSFAASQMPAVFLDLPALAESLQQVPLHQRLNLVAELVQISTPVELPTTTLTSKLEIPKTATFMCPSGDSGDLSMNQKVPTSKNPELVSDPKVSSSTVDSPPGVDDDEELDELLSLEKPDFGVAGNKSISAIDSESAVPENGCEEESEKMEVKEVPPPQPVSIRKEVTEEDLEDWLDSMIS